MNTVAHRMDDSPDIGMGDIGAVDRAFVVDDNITQDQVQSAMYQQSEGATDTEVAYTRVKVEKVHLSALRDAFNLRNPARSLKALCGRSPLVIDEELVHQPEHDGLKWSADVHFLDYLLAVSAKPGLWATLPNVAQDHNFNITLDLHRPYQQFKGKHGRLGFDPAGSMMYLGKCRSDDVWIALVATDQVNGQCEDVPAGTCTGSTQLSRRHHRMIIDFIVSCLSTLPGKAFIHFGEYRVPLDDKKIDWNVYTNVM